MPEIFRAFGLVFRLFPNDHDPPHVHVLHGSQRAKIFLDGPRIDDRSCCDLSVTDLRRALSLTAGNRELLLEEWRKLHAR